MTRTGVPITVIVATSVSALLVSSVIFFIVGFLCGLCFSRKVGGCIVTSEDRPSPNTPTPVYESITPTLNRLQEQDVELKENVAYM